MVENIYLHILASTEQAAVSELSSHTGASVIIASVGIRGDLIFTDLRHPRRIMVVRLV